METSYDRTAVCARRRPFELRSGLVRMYHCFGMDTSRKENLEYLDDGLEPVVAHVAGNAVIIVSLPSMNRRYIFGIDRNGVGSFVVHPERKSLAVGEKGRSPKLCIYEYPSLNLIKVLSGGAARTYACMCYSNSGDQLATVSGAPDFMLSIWDWNSEQMLLQSKAFGQEVYAVKFSPNDDGRLTTAGTGHIRFWKMASTFTGLKLQGDIGKFGKVELTDIRSFVELPNNQVLSSTETGALLLWEGNFIKFRIMRGMSKSCHDGEVTFLALCNENSVVSAGADGWIRYWDVKSITEADIDTDRSLDCILEPTCEVGLAKSDSPSSIDWILAGTGTNQHYFIRDSFGKLWKLETPSGVANASQAICISTFHSGPILALDRSPSDHFAATAGADGTVRCWDYIARRQLFLSAHNHPATSLCWAPASLDSQCRTVMVGFSNGVLRVLYRAATQWLQIQCFKPHNASITRIAVSQNGKYLATGCSAGIVFFVHTEEVDLGKSQRPYTPVGFLNVGGPVCSLCWRIGDSVLLTAANGHLAEVDCSGQLEPSEPGSYALATPIRELNIVFPQEKAPSEDQTGSPDDPERPPSHPDTLGPSPHVSCAAYFEEKTILTGFDDKRGMIHVISQETNTVLRTVAVGATILSVNYHVRLSCVVTSSDDGTVSLRHIDPEVPTDRVCLVSQPHDPEASVNGASLSCDGCFLLSAASDGLFVVQQVRFNELRSEACKQIAEDETENYFAPYEFILSVENLDSESCPASDGFHSAESDVPRDVHDTAKEVAHKQADDLPANAYSFEDSRVKSEQDSILVAAEKKKGAMREAIVQLRHEFDKTTRTSVTQEIQPRMREEYVIDPELDRLLADQGEALLQDVRRAHQRDAEYSKVLLYKLKDRYLNELENEAENSMEGQEMMALVSRRRVGSFRTTKVGGLLRQLLAQLHAELRGGKVSTCNDPSSEVSCVHVRDGLSSSSNLPSSKTVLDTAPRAHVAKDGNHARLSTLETRKLMRLSRQSKLAAIANERPSEDTDDPRDLQAIERAKLDLGDYKLKSGDAYQLPEKQQVNTEQKRWQMLLLQENVHSIKMRYNARFFSLRSVKKLVTLSLYDGAKLVGELSRALHVSNNDPGLPNEEIVLSLEEWPEYTRSLSKDEVELFRRCKVDESTSRETSMLLPFRNVAKGEPVANLPALRLLTKRATSEISELQREEDAMHRTMLGYQKESLMVTMNKHMHAFDDALNELRKEYMPLQADFKAAERRMLIFLQELSLLKNFETQDTALSTKLDRACREKHEASMASTECSSRLAAKKAERGLFKEQSQAILSELYAVAPPTHQFHVFLVNMFKRKIKRSKKRINDDGSSSDTEGEDVEDDDDDESEENDHDADDSCPGGCDENIYEQVIELREKRLDQEENLTEIQRTIDDLQRAHERYLQREKQISRDVISYSKEIRSFQTEKQQRLNMLFSSIALHVDQLHVFSPKVNNPTDSDNIVRSHPRVNLETANELQVTPMGEVGQMVLFSSNRLRKLHARIFELELMNKTEKANYKELLRTKRRLERAKVALDARIASLQTKCNDLQMLKFGQLIDLDVLDRDSSIVEGKETVNAKIRIITTAHTIELNKLKKSQFGLHEELLKLTQQNTKYLSQIAMASSRQFQLEKELNFNKSPSHSSTNGDSLPLIHREVEQRNRLVALVKLQAREIDALKVEINLLRRKGGHVYVPSLQGTTLGRVDGVPSVAGVTPGHENAAD